MNDDNVSVVKNKMNVKNTTTTTTTADAASSRHADMASRGVGPTGANEAGKAIKICGCQSTKDVFQAASTDAKQESAFDGIDLTDYVASLVIDERITSSASGKQADDQNKSERAQDAENNANGKQGTVLGTVVNSSETMQPMSVTRDNNNNNNVYVFPINRNRRCDDDDRNNSNISCSNAEATLPKAKLLPTATEQVDRMPCNDLIHLITDNTMESITDAATQFVCNATRSRDHHNNSI